MPTREKTASPVKLSSHPIREKVEQRHWQLFETRLKHPLTNNSDENYTKINDYRIIDRSMSRNSSEKHLEPYRRWNQFSSRLTTQTNEQDQLVTLFRNVWLTNWNVEQNYEISRRNSVKSIEKLLKLNENDRKVISSIRHK